MRPFAWLNVQRQMIKSIYHLIDKGLIFLILKKFVKEDQSHCGKWTRNIGNLQKRNGS